MIYVLAYPQFEPRLAARLEAFRAVHEPERAQILRPHITLLFGVARAHEANIAALFVGLIGVMPSFWITFGTTKVVHDPYDKAFKLFLVCDEGGENVVALHRHMYDGPHIAELNPEVPYEPHMTVGASQDEGNLKAARIRDIGPLPIEAVVRELALVEYSGGKLSTLAVTHLS
ncbi:MAG: 2'-5' RNA ligase family protein [Pseudomonadota bacterium]